MIWHDLAHEYHETMTTQPMLGPPCIENVWTQTDKPFTTGWDRHVSTDAYHTHPYLSTVAGGRMTVGAVPLRVRGGDGAPARIFAVQG